VTTRIAYVLLVLCLGFGAGCSGTGNRSSIPVTGRVTVGGGVWERGGSVLFQSDVTSETSAIDTQGRFALRLPPGTYRVAIEPPGGLPVERPDPKQTGIPRRYMLPSTSGISVSVDGEHSDIAIALDGA
jgi:hypothetical protein